MEGRVLEAEHQQALADLFTEEDTLRGALETVFEIMGEEAKVRAQAELLSSIPNFNKAMKLAAEADAYENAMARIRQVVEESVRPAADESGGQSAG